MGLRFWSLLFIEQVHPDLVVSLSQISVRPVSQQGHSSVLGRIHGGSLLELTERILVVVGLHQLDAGIVMRACLIKSRLNFLALLKFGFILFLSGICLCLVAGGYRLRGRHTSSTLLLRRSLTHII